MSRSGLFEKKKRGPKEKHPWSTMQIGDSFFVDQADVMPSSVRTMASTKGRDLGRKFSVTSGAGGMHVDRVS